MSQRLLSHLPKESLVRKWVEAWEPTEETPIAYMIFGAMCMLGAALGRRVYLRKGAHTLYPMLNTLLIGPSGVGKSTSILKISKPLIDSLPMELRPQFIGGKATPEKLHDDLVVDPHAVVFASELANFFSKTQYMADMIPYVTQLLDYEPTVERRTRSSDLLVVKNPSVTIVGGSTVEWLQDQLPDSAASGGFLARFLIVKELHKSRRIPDPETVVRPEVRFKLEQQKQDVLSEFGQVIHLKGEIGYANPLARDAYSVWYQAQVPSTGALSPFSARAGEFVLRLATLVCISCGRMGLSETDIEAAIALYNYALMRLHEVVIPFSPAGKLLAKVLEAVGTRPTKTPEICRALRNFAPAQDVQRMLESLTLSKDVVVTPDGYRRALAKDIALGN